MTTYEFIVAVIAGLPALVTAIGVLIHNMQSTKSLDTRVAALEEKPEIARVVVPKPVAVTVPELPIPPRDDRWPQSPIEG